MQIKASVKKIFLLLYILAIPLLLNAGSQGSTTPSDRLISTSPEIPAFLAAAQSSAVKESLLSDSVLLPGYIDPSPVNSVQGDWAGYFYNERSFDEPWVDPVKFIMLLRMIDEEHGVFGFCSDMSDMGSGCAVVRASKINDCEIQFTVEKWFYRTGHDEYTIPPEDFTFILEHYRELSDEDSEEYEYIFYSRSPSYRKTTDLLVGKSGDSGDNYDILFARMITGKESTFPTWYDQYAGLNGILEGVFGFGEFGGDNINTSNVFVFPLEDGAFRLRYTYTEFGDPLESDCFDWGIPEYTKNEDVYGGGYMGIEPWISLWQPTKDTQIICDGERFSSFYKKQYIPYLIRCAQTYEWEDGFEERMLEEWGKEQYWDNQKIIMYKKLIFASQEILAGRFDGNPDKLSSLLENYKPDAVEIDHYSPENDPNAFILYRDLDMCGKKEEIIGRFYRWDGAEDMPLDSVQLILNGQAYFNLYGYTINPELFTVDIDKSDQTIELAIGFTQEDGNGYIRLFRCFNNSISDLGYIWGKLNNEFTGIGMVAEFPGDGTVVTYVPKDDGFIKEIVSLEEPNGVWINGVYFGSFPE